jgi:hypothetical protein
VTRTFRISTSTCLLILARHWSAKFWVHVFKFRRQKFRNFSLGSRSQIFNRDCKPTPTLDTETAEVAAHLVVLVRREAEYILKPESNTCGLHPVPVHQVRLDSVSLLILQSITVVEKNAHPGIFHTVLSQLRTMEFTIHSLELHKFMYLRQIR